VVKAARDEDGFIGNVLEVWQISPQGGANPNTAGGERPPSPPYRTRQLTGNANNISYFTNVLLHYFTDV
jgi:hypothetical protein